MAAKLIKGIGECSGCLPVAGWRRCAGRNGLRVCAAAHAICDVRTVAADCRSVGLWLRASCKLAGPVARCCGSGGAGCALDSGAQVPLAAAMVTNGLMYMPLKLKEVCFGQKEGDVYGVLPLQVDWFGKKGGGLWRKPR